jgi:hypothetical protein
MKTNRAAIWAGLLLIFGMTFGCTKVYLADGGPPSQRRYYIHIRKVGGQCVIDIKTLTILLSDHPTVEWVSDDNETYTAHFEAKTGLPNPVPGTPFDDGHGNPMKDIRTNQGPQTPKRKGEYEYSVLDGNNTECIPPTDPGVYIK